MRSPPGRGQQLDLLRSEQRTEFHGKAFDEVLVGKYRSPVRAPVGIVVELPEMDELIDRAGVGLEIADQLLVLAAFLERRVAELAIQLDGLGHLADVKRVGTAGSSSRPRKPTSSSTRRRQARPSSGRPDYRWRTRC